MHSAGMRPTIPRSPRPPAMPPATQASPRCAVPAGTVSTLRAAATSTCCSRRTAAPGTPAMRRDHRGATAAVRCRSRPALLERSPRWSPTSVCRPAPRARHRFGGGSLLGASRAVRPGRGRGDPFGARDRPRRPAPPRRSLAGRQTRIAASPSRRLARSGPLDHRAPLPRRMLAGTRPRRAPRGRRPRPGRPCGTARCGARQRIPRGSAGAAHRRARGALRTRRRRESRERRTFSALQLEDLLVSTYRGGRSGRRERVKELGGLAVTLSHDIAVSEALTTLTERETQPAGRLTV